MFGITKKIKVSDDIIKLGKVLSTLIPIDKDWEHVNSTTGYLKELGGVLDISMFKYSKKKIYIKFIESYSVEFFIVTSELKGYEENLFFEDANSLCSGIYNNQIISMFSESELNYLQPFIKKYIKARNLERKKYQDEKCKEFEKEKYQKKKEVRRLFFKSLTTNNIGN